MSAAPAKTDAAKSSDTAAATFTVRVAGVFDEAPGICRFELEDPAGRKLPGFTAGAHIDVHLADGVVRQYSLSGSPACRRRYEIAVLREANGRGGSRAMHDTLRAGSDVTISEPRNRFPLTTRAERHLLLAGGIGVTPMMAMIAELEDRGADYQMHYCTRAPEVTAFANRLAPLRNAGKVIMHHDGGDPRRGLDLAALLAVPEVGTHVYCCGPAGFMAAASAGSAHWPQGTVHFEYFAAPQDDGEPGRRDLPFQVRVASTGELFDVPADKAIIQVLRENGVPVDTSCEDGYCGTCMTRYLSGEPEHRDVVLDEEDRAEFVMICCARARTPILVLDL